MMSSVKPQVALRTAYWQCKSFASVTPEDRLATGKLGFVWKFAIKLVCYPANDTDLQATKTCIYVHDWQ